MKSRARTKEKLTAWGARSLAIGVLVAGHAYAQGDPDGIRGLPLVLDHLFGLGLTLALLALCAGVGRFALRRAALDIDSAIERCAFAVALGAASVAIALLLLGSLGALGPWVIGLTLAFFAALARHELHDALDDFRASVRELREVGRLPALCVFAVVGACLLLLSACPPSDYDSLMYHVRIPSQFLERGAIFVPEDNLHVAFVGLVHMLYLPLLAAGAPAACAILNACFAMVLGALVLTFGRRWFSAAVGRLSLLLLWGSGIVALTAATPKVDVTLALYLFLGHCALHRAALEKAEARKWLVLAGVVLGSAIGVKYLGVLYIVALIPVYAMLWRREGAPRGGYLRALTAAGVALVVAVTPWLVKNQLLLGAPLYPYFAQRLLPPWVAAIYEERGLTASGDRLETSALRSVREPFDVVDWFLSPQRLTPELEGGAYRANPAFLLLPFALWWLRDRKLIGVLLPSVGYLAGLFLISDRVNLRYLVPALPMLTVAAATTMDRLMERVRWSRLRVATLVFGLTIVLAPVAAALWHKLESTRALPHAVGRESRGEFLLAKTNREVSGYARMVARVNERLSEQSRLLLLIEGRGHGFRPRVLQDNVLKNWPLLLPAVAQPYCLESSGITHVLVGTGTLNYFKNRGLDLEVLQWDRFEEFSARCLEPIDIEPGMALYRVKTPRT